MNDDTFQDPAGSGVFHISIGHAPRALAAAESAGLRVLRADAGGSSDRNSILAELGKALHFPEWYGANLDALHDCLTDPDWELASGHVLMVSGLDTLCCAAPDDLQTLISVFRSACELRRESGSPLWILLDTAAPDLPSLFANEGP